ncbi:hypothetical protein BDR07DRAFT_1416285 [Suillus spraguei]|nr:hypothetical protein BDR07DRAFT_1416285 [Suillus spraguei]
MDPSEIKEKIGRFRILTIGRANAGKTTILRRVCNTRENPVIYDCAGKRCALVDPAVLDPSRERGEHNIENELVFPSNPGFVFHDSRGFEAGGESEFDQVKEFIASRSFTAGEVKFFPIPVIVLFTKFDAFYDVAYGELKSKGKSIKDARALAPTHAEKSFANGPQLEFLKGVRWPPKCHVCLPNMDKDDADCGPLIERTAGTLDSDVLQRLFVSTQQINLELCMKYAVEQ